MKNSLTKAVFAIGLSAVFASASAAVAQPQTNVRTKYMKTDRSVCKESLHYPGADGSTAMAELPESVLLYNYRHVTGPNPLIQRRRAIGALRCYSDLDSSGYMIGLRGAFEAMGGTVSIGRDKKTIDVEKAGASIKLTIGKPEVTINGETRPLDVPPIVYRGIIYVPIRVVSEALGGYVIWDGMSHSVVIRYVPQLASAPTPPPPPTTVSPTPVADLPTPIPTPVATVAPSATPVPFDARKFERFVVGDFLFSSKTYNQFNPGDSSGTSFAARAAIEFPLGNLPVMIGGDYRTFAYPHYADAFVPNAAGSAYVPCPLNGFRGCVSVPGQNASVYVGRTDLRDSSISGNVGIAFLPHTYVAGSYLAQFNTFPDSYPKVPTLSGFGFGVDRLPDFSSPVSVYGSVFYYPSIAGNYTVPLGLPVPVDSGGKIEQRFLKYQIGGTLNLGNSGLFLDAGFLGDTIRGKNLSPGDSQHQGGYIGLGLKF